MENSPEKVVLIPDDVNQHYLGSLKPQSHYVFRLMARTAAGMGPPLTGKGHTLLDGGSTSVASYHSLFYGPVVNACSNKC